jgi:hypothetical protein
MFNRSQIEAGHNSPPTSVSEAHGIPDLPEY